MTTETFPATYRTMYASHADEPCLVTVTDGVHTATFTDGTVEVVPAGTLTRMPAADVVIIDVNDDLTGEHVPAVEECPTCHAGPFAGETVTAALDNFDAHAARCNA